MTPAFQGLTRPPPIRCNCEACKRIAAGKDPSWPARSRAAWSFHEIRRMRAIVAAVKRHGGSRSAGMREAAARLGRSFDAVVVRFSILRRGRVVRARLRLEGRL
jgi:hypothetical protein